MTTLLQQAFAEAAKLPQAEQLAALAQEALAEHRAGLTEQLDPERL